MIQERRKEPIRRRQLKAGTIAFGYGGGISCVVRNLSRAGACLEVTSPVGIPDRFDLLVESDNLRQGCRVAWRREKRIGVEFV
ncbi:MAG TPA: PilZ domain-containing protein [Pseudorhodoplanes sp.]|jgi:hypothetical protein|nr:PilZ domain-containing protein [Pseudorhodoplanes sp.]